MSHVRYIDIAVSDEDGIVKMNNDVTLSVSVKNGTLLGFGSAAPRTEEEFTTGTYTTYRGRAQAVVLADDDCSITITPINNTGINPITVNV